MASARVKINRKVIQDIMLAIVKAIRLIPSEMLADKKAIKIVGL